MGDIVNTKKICQAMTDSGIADPESPEGIDFCLTDCPYSYCVPMESREVRAANLRKERISRVKSLRAAGFTVEEIAIFVEASERTVRTLLKNADMD